ncbi:MAG: transaldolase [Chloroflexi bacterium]|nr:transaldolase [Chloroflexota bacterium]MCI0577073.1 transaldolase [Chloroflexota bacterium]MCI0650161.1 transaldolase [Chloroflexota bacterium]MCI0728016.1 transaldolase [Chloroflexota bacterium]
MNPLIELQAFGQSFWYDNIRRKFLQDGTLQRLVGEDGLRGMTSNPSIFEKAIGESDDYDEQIGELVDAGADVPAVYEALALADIQAACDMFAGVYRESGGGDGYVSLEVSPHLADDTDQTIAEARRLFAAVGRPNVMIKVPATPAGIPAIRQLIGEGINVNITLMFSMDHYEAVARAYMDGLTRLLENGGDPARVASVASFFVSRVDSAVDKKLAALNDPAAEALMGQAAIANSKLVYQRFKEIFHGEAFARLRSAGAPAQRLLWASTSTKNPNYPDTLYIDELIGPETVNTMPPQTVDAFRDHGRVATTLEQDVAGAQLMLDNLAELGINLDEVTEQLQVEGVAAFAKSFDALMATLREKMAALAGR